MAYVEKSQERPEVDESQLLEHPRDVDCVHPSSGQPVKEKALDESNPTSAVKDKRKERLERLRELHLRRVCHQKGSAIAAHICECLTLL